MNFELKSLDISTLAHEKTDMLLVFLTFDVKLGKDLTSRLIAKAMKSGDFVPKVGQLLDIHRPAGFACKRLVLVHAGDGSTGDIKTAVNSPFALVKQAKVAGVSLCFLQRPAQSIIRVVLTALAEATYVYTSTKTKAEGRIVKNMTLFVPEHQFFENEFKQGVAAVKGIELAKEWGNRPANHATPTKLAQAARTLAKRSRITCEVLGPKQVAKLKMGAFQAVAQGSDEPLRFVVLRYSGAGRNTPPAVLIGKGITFDSGGISIKPAAEMDEMKFDMCGAASVLGVFSALGELQPNINVVGLIPACENLLSGHAIKPGDVVTSMSGQTIEVLNTDAEGRLILCDALTYAQRFKPRVVVDIATLTGACVIALGAVRSGLFSNDEKLAAGLMSAGVSSQDLCWQMPLDDAYADGLKSNFADVANVAGRAGGAVTAAKFLQRFAGHSPWAHLDIAGTAWKSGAAKGATGRPVGLLVDYLMSLSTKDQTA